VNQVRWRVTAADRFALHVDVYRMHEGMGPDLDNVVKAISDAVQGAGLAMPDDRYVRRIAAALHHNRERPRVEVRITKLALAPAEPSP
jgi:Holliday junction resolvase RusA-like endonuclease